MEIDSKHRCEPKIENQLTRNLFDKSMVWMATIPLCDRSRLQSASAAIFVKDMTGIFVNELCDKSKLNAKYKFSKRKTNYQFRAWIVLKSATLTIPLHHQRIFHRAMISSYYVISSRFVIPDSIWIRSVVIRSGCYGIDREPVAKNWVLFLYKFN